MMINNGSGVNDSDASNGEAVQADSDNTTDITQDINILKEGKYKIAVRYKNVNAGSTSHVDVLVDGTNVLSHDGAASSYAVLITDEIELTEGAHTIEVKGTASDADSALIFDYIAIFPITSDYTGRYDFPADWAYDMMKRSIKYKIWMGD